MKRKTKGALQWYESGVFSDEIVHGFSTKLGGVSQGDFSGLNLISARGDAPSLVAENYRIFSQGIGFTGDNFARNAQVHGAEIRLVTEGESLSDFVDAEGVFPSGDGLMTQEKNLALWTYFADCVPILYHDPVTKSIAAVHAGWRGTAQGIAEKTVTAMGEAFGTKARDLRVSLGPSIGPCCFSCHEDVVQAMSEALGAEIAPFLQEEGGGKWAVDLQGINCHLLERIGVLHLEGKVPCTACHPEEFWSHRVLGDKRGSMGAMIALKGEHHGE